MFNDVVGPELAADEAAQLASALQGLVAEVRLRLAEREAQARSALEATRAQSAELSLNLSETRSALDTARAQLADADRQIAATEAERAEVFARLTATQAELSAVYGTRLWLVSRLAKMLRRRFVDRTRAALWASRSVARTAAIRSLLWTARQMTAWRLRCGRARTLWGVTPILTLPLLAECDRRLGLRSHSLVYTTYYITRKFDINLEWALRLAGRVSYTLHHRFLLCVLAWALLRYDFFHFFLDRGLLTPAGRMAINPREMSLLQRASKRLYTYTYGADVRTREATLRLGRYNFCVDCPEPLRFCVCDDAEGVRTVSETRGYATAMLAMGDMLAYVPDAIELHFWPIDTASLVPAPPDYCGGRPLRVLHAPNHSHFKGTRHLEAAVERLRTQGYAIELVLVQGVPNREVLAMMRECDLVAEQFIGGFHGYTALEAMALAKPVISYVRDRRMLAGEEECPLLDADPDRLEDVLRECLTGVYDLAALGRQGRAYVEKHHSIDAVAARLGRLYLATAALPSRQARRLSVRLREIEARLATIAVPIAVAVERAAPKATRRPDTSAIADIEVYDVR